MYIINNIIYIFNNLVYPIGIHIFPSGYSLFLIYALWVFIYSLCTCIHVYICEWLCSAYIRYCARTYRTGLHDAEA